MYSSRDLIDALLARGRRRLGLRERAAQRQPGEFPPGWRDWFASMRERVGAVTGATAEAIVAIFLGRELSAPAAASAGLNRWQAFTALWRQEWHVSDREPAHERIAAITITLLTHLLLAVLILLAAYVRVVGPAAPPGHWVVVSSCTGPPAEYDSSAPLF